jgi:hypothetical protein
VNIKVLVVGALWKNTNDESKEHMGGRVMLKWVVKKEAIRMQTNFNRHRTGSNDGFCGVDSMSVGVSSGTGQPSYAHTAASESIVL